jgi:ATP-dependent Clp protease ATP-binding subunit ClpA
MFERFTPAARHVLVAAQDEARRLGHDWIGTEHLLLGLVGRGEGARDVLTELGLSLDAVREEVVEAIGTGCPGGAIDERRALAAIGIDLDAVRRSVEAAFGPGALDRGRAGRPCEGTRFTPRAKKVLELSLREALALGQDVITGEHVLLGLLREGEGVAAMVLQRFADPGAVRAAVLARLARAH